MKSPAELASRLRKMILAAQHHYSPTGTPLRSIVVSPEWLEDMADAAHLLDRHSAALNSIAAWHDGNLGPHMDEPGSAQIARDALGVQREQLHADT